MASSYTVNNGIEKISTGEQAGTWGSTTNTNFDIIDRAINGVGAITLSGTASTLTTSDGTLSNGHFKVLVFGGTLSATHTVTIAPNDQDKLYFVVNSTSGSQSVTISQGSGTNVTVASGKSAIVYADGAGAGANVAQITTSTNDFDQDVTINTDDGALLTLETSDTTITDGDVLGALQFRAPSEDSGTDATAVAGSIVAEAKAAFSATDASTDMVFKVGTDVADDNAAVEKMRLTHDGDLEVKAADGAILKLQTTSTDVTDGNVLGAIEFNAPLEAGDTDSRETAAAIVAEADDTFAADNNETDLVFKLGVSEAATEKFRFAHEGDFDIRTDNRHIFFGDNGDVRISHIHDTGLAIKNTATGDNSTIFLKLQTGELDIQADDVLGKILFEAPDEGSGSSAFDNKKIAAAIQARSEGDFSDTSNATTLDFMTGSSEDATTKMTLASNGALAVTGDITAFSSDERLKNFEGTISSPLEKIKKLNGYNFTWNDKAKELDEHLFKDQKEVGVSAQEVQAVCPEVVKSAPFNNDYLTVQYEKLVPLLIEAIKEQQKQIDELKKDN